MLDFYKKATAVFAPLLSITLLLAWYSFKSYYKVENLLPANDAPFIWEYETEVDEESDQGSTLAVLNSTHSLQFRYALSDAFVYPYVKLYVSFKNREGLRMQHDFSQYYKIAFNIRCSKSNVLTFNLRTFDELVSKVDDLSSYRLASYWLVCSDHWSAVDVDLQRLEVPDWWLEQYGFGVQDRDYQLDQVVAFSFDSSRKGVVGEGVNIQVSNLKLFSYDRTYIVVFAVCFVLIWGSYIFWLFRQYSRYLARDIQKKFVKDKPLVAYQQLSLESHKDRESTAVLNYLAKNYCNSDLNLELLTRELGVNNKKVNEILKEQLGFTFRAYLNKLRLTEAARLLRENDGNNINEIALSVGYKNVTHFNKMFKDEYGCSPGKFKALQFSKQTDS